MKVLDDLASRVQRLLTTPGAELGRGARFLRFQIHLWRLCARRLHEHNATAMSAALSFRTIFTLIPLLVLAVLVMQSVGMVEQGKASLRRFLTDSGFAQIQEVRREPEGRPGQWPPPENGASSRPDPASQAAAAPQEAAGPAEAHAGPQGISVADWLEARVEEAQQKLTFGTVGPVGIALLIWTALTLLTTIEGCLNRVFGAPRSRGIGRRVMLYWAAVTLGPIVLGVASYLASQAAAWARESVSGLGHVLAAVSWAGPVLLGIVMLAALYKLMPNTKVRYRAAIGGAMVAVPLWLLAKWGFSMYVTNLVGQRNFYGELGLAPVFLLWLNWSWLIFLFGAELANTAANLSRLQSAELAERSVVGPEELLAGAVAVAGPFGRASGPVAFDDIAASVALPDALLRRVLDRLAAAGIVCAVETPPNRPSQYVLARPAGRVTLADVLELAGPGAGEARYGPAVAQAVARARRRAGAALGEVTLADVAGGEGEG